MTDTQRPLNINHVFIKAHAVASILKDTGIFGKPSEHIADKLAADLEQQTFIYNVVRHATNKDLPSPEDHLDLAFNDNTLRMRVEVEVQDKEAILRRITIDEHWSREKTVDWPKVQKVINEQLAYGID